MFHLIRFTLLALALSSPVHVLSQDIDIGDIDVGNAFENSIGGGDGLAPSSIEEVINAPYDLDSPENNVLIDRFLPIVGDYLLGELGVGRGDAPIVLRWTFAIASAWFDALAPYHPTAVGVYTDLGRNPGSVNETQGDQSIAVLYASARVLSWMNSDSKVLWDSILLGLELDPTDMHEGSEDPIGIGNAAAAGVIAARSNDGFNQLGFDDGRMYNPKPFSDSTGYVPTNSPYVLTDARKWQPDLVTSPDTGLTKAQAFVTPQLRLTQPLSYSNPSAFSAPMPVKSYDVATEGQGAPGGLYRHQVDQVLSVSASLTDQQKLMAEFFDDKLFSLGRSNVFYITSRQLGLMDFVHLDYVHNLAAVDAGIVVWQEKARWDAVRPFSAVRELYGDQSITAWGGVGVGTVDDITGSEWRPYMQSADHPEYPSASAAFCAAHSETSRLVLGSDDLGLEVEVAAGTSLREPGVTPAAVETLSFPTWTQFEEDCGDSRVWGGVHFPDAVPAGQAIGREVGRLAYEFFQDHLNNEGQAGSLRGFTAGASS